MENIEQTINRRDALKTGTLIGALALGGLFSSAQALTKNTKP